MSSLEYFSRASRLQTAFLPSLIISRGSFTCVEAEQQLIVLVDKITFLCVRHWPRDHTFEAILVRCFFGTDGPLLPSFLDSIQTNNSLTPPDGESLPRTLVNFQLRFDHQPVTTSEFHLKHHEDWILLRCYPIFIAACCFSTTW